MRKFKLYVYCFTLLFALGCIKEEKVLETEIPELYILNAIQSQDNSVDISASILFKTSTEFEVGFYLFDNNGKVILRKSSRKSQVSETLNENIKSIGGIKIIDIALFAVDKNNTNKEYVSLKEKVKTINKNIWQQAENFPANNQLINGYCFKDQQTSMQFVFYENSETWKVYRHFQNFRSGNNTWFDEYEFRPPFRTRFTPRIGAFHYTVIIDEGGFQRHSIIGGGYKENKFNGFNDYFTDFYSFSLAQSIPEFPFESVNSLAFGIGYEGFIYQPENGHKLFRKFFLNDTELATTVPSLGIGFQHQVAATKTQGYILSVDFKQAKTVFRQYNPKTNSFRTLADFPGISRTNGTFWGTETDIYFGLGQSTDNFEKGLSDIWKYDVKQNKWFLFSEYAGSGNVKLQVQDMGTYALIFGGLRVVPIKNESNKILPTNDTWFMKY